MDPRPHALYRFYADDGALLYVGITLDPGARWRAHRAEKPWWQEVASITIQIYPDRDAVMVAETQAILDEHPRFNIVHNITVQGVLDVTDDLDQLLLAVTGSRPESGPWGSRAEHMPDQCPRCRPGGIYLPYEWRTGDAVYHCAHGHTWTCWWGHDYSGDAHDNRGREAS